jgi:hypothetical protein
VKERHVPHEQERLDDIPGRAAAREIDGSRDGRGHAVLIEDCTRHRPVLD